MFICRVFRYVRRQRGETLRSFAPVMGLHHSTLSAYELGKRAPSSETINKLVEISEAPDLKTLVACAYGFQTL